MVYRGWEWAEADGASYNSTLVSPIVTLMVGPDQRVFAAHEDVLSLSPFFATHLKGQFFEGAPKKVALPDEYVLHTLALSPFLCMPYPDVCAECQRSFPASSSTSTKETTTRACSTTSVTTPSPSKTPTTPSTSVAADPLNPQSSTPGQTAISSKTPPSTAPPRNSAWRN